MDGARRCACVNQCIRSYNHQQEIRAQGIPLVELPGQRCAGGSPQYGTVPGTGQKAGGGCFRLCRQPHESGARLPVPALYGGGLPLEPYGIRRRPLRACGCHVPRRECRRCGDDLYRPCRRLPAERECLDRTARKADRRMARRIRTDRADPNAFAQNGG